MKELIVEAVLAHYVYRGDAGRKRIAEIVRQCVGVDSANLTETGRSVEGRLEEAMPRHRSYSTP